MDASCGPSNALTQLSKHTQRDTSLQHERFRGQPQLPQNTFRNQPGIDANLNSQFAQFNEGNFAMDSALHAQNAHFRQQHAPPVPGQQAAAGPGWVQDFNQLSIHNKPQQQSRAQTAQSGQQTGWHQQFMQQNNTQQGFAQHEMAGMHQRYQPMMGQSFMPQRQQAVSAQSQNQMESLEIDSAAFDSQFDRLEREMAMEESEQVPSEENYDDQLFAEAAMQVRKSMTEESATRSQETAEKFQQLNFLKLMNQISDKQVAISKDGDKLVEKELGQDIRSHLSDPLRYEKQAMPDYHQPAHEVQGFAPMAAPAEPVTTNESQNVRSHLPDPLAHIKEGSLPGDLTPLQAARIISGGQVQSGEWMEDTTWDEPQPTVRVRRTGILTPEEQEVYDDYRNHDDAF